MSNCLGFAAVSNVTSLATSFSFGPYRTVSPSMTYKKLAGANSFGAPLVSPETQPQVPSISANSVADLSRASEVLSGRAGSRVPFVTLQPLAISNMAGRENDTNSL